MHHGTQKRSLPLATIVNTRGGTIRGYHDYHQSWPVLHPRKHRRRARASHSAGCAPCPFTERFFRDAGVGPGQRVLDIGSGVGDVAMLAAKLVGPSGEVVGVERDPGSIARARARVADVGLRNVTFTQSDVSQISSSKPFDAVVGRFILMFLPDPLAVLRSLTPLVRPGGVVAFHELSWAPFLLLAARLPLWFAATSVIHETFRRSGANTEMGFALYQIFQQAGLPAPTRGWGCPPARVLNSNGGSPTFLPVFF